jgi:flagellar biosynthesis/type III secretory pathway ATPase
LLERAGSTGKGSITAFYTILLSSEQIEDPLSEEIRAILDGHLYLSSKLAQSQHYPAIDPLRSNSRVMDNIAGKEHRKIAETIKRLWSAYEDNRDLILLGAYKKGSDLTIDEALAKRQKLLNFLIQSKDDCSELEQTIEHAKKSIA